MTKLMWFAVMGAAATQLVACVGSGSEDAVLDDGTPEPASQAEQGSLSSAQEQAVDDVQPSDDVAQTQQPLDASTDEATGEAAQGQWRGGWGGWGGWRGGWGGWGAPWGGWRGGWGGWGGWRGGWGGWGAPWGGWRGGWGGWGAPSGGWGGWGGWGGRGWGGGWGR